MFFVSLFSTHSHISFKILDLIVCTFCLFLIRILISIIFLILKCDQLLKSETRKSEDLASLLKIREKALIDRFKGQIAWLELQKQKFRESGLTAEISMIKKKQRALLLRLNNDRKELHRILKSHQQNNSARNASNVNFNISHMTTNMSIRRTSVSQQMNNAAPKRALKAIELPGGGSALEMYVFVSLHLMSFGCYIVLLLSASNESSTWHNVIICNLRKYCILDK